jgi:hypothetical protein
MQYAMIAAVALAVVALAVVGGTMAFRKSFTKPSSDRHESEKFNYSFATPAGWEPDGPTRTKIGSNLVTLKRSKPDAYFAVAGQDFGERSPREQELRDGVEKRVRGCFGENAGVEGPTKERKIAGQPALHYVFQGDLDDVSMAGECFAFHYKGIAYWMFTFCPNDADTLRKAAPEFEDLRKRFALGTARDAWKEKSGSRTYTGTTADYGLTDEESVWEVQDPRDVPVLNPELKLAKPDLHLRAFDPAAKTQRDRNDLRRAAELFVFVIPAKGDPIQTAKDFILEREKETGSEGAKFEAASDRAGADEGEAPARGAERLKLERSASSLSFVALSAAASGDKVVAAWGECRWESRALWERTIVRTVGSFKLRGAGER